MNYAPGYLSSFHPSLLLWLQFSSLFVPTGKISSLTIRMLILCHLMLISRPFDCLRIRRRSANSNWSWLDRSMASEKSGTETPAPQYEHPPSYSSCFPSTPVLHHAHHIMISNANISHGNMPLSSSISISLSKTTSYGSTSDLTANPNCTSPETSVVTYPSSHHHHHNDHHNDHNGNSSCSGSKAAKEEV